MAANPLQDHACVTIEGLKHLVLGPHTAVTLHFGILGEEIVRDSSPIASR
jgi:hypothetical protein